MRLESHWRMVASIVSLPVRLIDYGLRKYAGVPETAWGGEAGHAHEWGATLPAVKPGQVPQTKWAGVAAVSDGQRAGTGAFCECGSWRDPLALASLYFRRMAVAVARARRAT